MTGRSRQTKAARTTLPTGAKSTQPGTSPATRSPLRPRNFYEAVYAVVAELPQGSVVNYGTIATWLGSPRAARAVGYALAADAAGPLPWQRVVNAAGGISVGGAPWRPDEQLRRLRAEKVPFVDAEHVDLRAASFQPSAAQQRRWLAMGDWLRKQTEARA